ncbi:MAG: hypothetical protein AB1489_19815 [Acidobacteriota bacterium]
MKDMILLLVAVLFAYTLPGQDANDPDSKLHKVEELQLMNLPTLNGSAGTSSSMGSSTSMGTSTQASPRWSIQFRLKNFTPKTVKKVYWYFKVLDPSEDTLNKVFQTKRKIKGQNDSTISEEFSCNPQLISSQTKFTVEVTRIEYEDGTYWEHPAAKPEKE